LKDLELLADFDFELFDDLEFLELSSLLEDLELLADFDFTIFEDDLEFLEVFPLFVRRRR